MSVKNIKKTIGKISLKRLSEVNSDNFYIEKTVNSFTKKNFSKIINLGDLYKKTIINNENKNIIKFISKNEVTKAFLIDVFNHPENIENNKFMTPGLMNNIHEEIDFEYVYEYSIPKVDMSNKLFFYVNKNVNLVPKLLGPNNKTFKRIEIQIVIVPVLVHVIKKNFYFKIELNFT